MDSFSVRPKWIIFPALHVEANSAYDSSKPIGEATFDLGCTYNFDPEDSTLHASVFMENDLDEELNLEYKFNIHIYSVFSISENYDSLSDKTRKKVTTDVAGLLLGSIREMLVTLTSRGPWGAYILPFLDINTLTRDLMKSYQQKG